MEREMEDKVQALRTAMKGFGTDEKTLTNVVLSYNKQERQKLKLNYKTSFGRDLIEDIHKEISGNYRLAMEALFEDPIEYDAKLLYKSMKGLGTDDDTLIELVCSRPTNILRLVSAKFKELYKKELSDWVKSETSGNYRKILISVLTCDRSETKVVDDEKMKTTAHQLYTAGEGKLGTDEQFFNTVFARSSPAEMVQISNWYKQLTGGKDLRIAIDKEFSFNLKKALMTIYDCLICPSEYFARRINEAVKGLGTDDPKLIRVLVSREEIDLPQIREKYKELFNKDMIEDIKGDTSGNYRNLLLGLASK